MVMIPPDNEVQSGDQTPDPNLPTSPTRAVLAALEEAGLLSDDAKPSVAEAVVASALSNHGVVDAEVLADVGPFRCELWGRIQRDPGDPAYGEGQILMPGARFTGNGSPIDRICVLGSIAHTANVIAATECGLEPKAAAQWFGRAMAACAAQRNADQAGKIILAGDLPPSVLARIRHNGKGGGQ